MTQSSPLQRSERSSGIGVFGNDAVGYHAGRIGYPEELYDALFKRVTSHPDILEIGAGTGLATEALLARGPGSVTVVEPDSELVTFMAKRLCNSQLSFINGSFPEAEITDHFDLAVCAAAFHWLDPKPALARVRTLLRPGGIWAMWWNSYRNVGIGDPLSDAIVPMLKGITLPPSEGPEGHYAFDNALHERTLAEAGFGAIDYQLYRRERFLSADEVVALYQSYSFIRLLPDTQRIEFLRSLAELVEREFDGQALNIVVTACYSAQSL